MNIAVLVRDADRNALALGVFGRAYYEAGMGRVGFQVYADLHGWIGFDRKGANLAGAASVGANVWFSF